MPWSESEPTASDVLHTATHTSWVTRAQFSGIAFILLCSNLVVCFVCCLDCRQAIGWKEKIMLNLGCVFRATGAGSGLRGVSWVGGVSIHHFFLEFFGSAAIQATAPVVRIKPKLVDEEKTQDVYRQSGGAITANICEGKKICAALICDLLGSHRKLPFTTWSTAQPCLVTKQRISICSCKQPILSMHLEVHLRILGPAHLSMCVATIQ